MAFPTSPENNDTTSINGVYYIYNATYNSWTKTNSPVATGHELDELSYYADGLTNTFTLYYNQVPVTINSAFNLTVTLNGIQQPSFDYNYDNVWLGKVLAACEGFTIDPEGKLRFADSVPAGTNIHVKTKNANLPERAKVYPFHALDIMTGY